MSEIVLQVSTVITRDFQEYNIYVHEHYILLLYILQYRGNH